MRTFFSNRFRFHTIWLFGLILLFSVILGLVSEFQRRVKIRQKAVIWIESNGGSISFGKVEDASTIDLPEKWIFEGSTRYQQYRKRFQTEPVFYRPCDSESSFNIVDIYLHELENGEFIERVKAFKRVKVHMHLRLSNHVDLSELQCFSHLELLDLQNAKFCHYDFLHTLKNLKSLNLRGSNISDLDPLSQLNSLQDLCLANASSVKDIIGLKQLKSLRSLDLTNTRVWDLKPIASIETLEVLSIGAGGQTINLSPLRRLSRLRHLSISGSAIEELETIVSLTQLESLCLSETGPVDPAFFLRIPKLNRLQISADAMPQPCLDKLKSQLKDCHVIVW